MPTSRELTQELNAWLSRRKLMALNTLWRQEGRGYSEEAIGVLGDALAQEQTDYATILRTLEVRFRQLGNTLLGREFHGLYAWLIDVVYRLLYLRHTLDEDAFRRRLLFLDGIARLASKSAPLWVFSLSQDLSVECVAAAHRVPLRSGFGGELVPIAIEDDAGRRITALSAESIEAERLGGSGLSFLPPGAPGINLLKVYGSLDVFGVGGGRGLLKLRPQGPGAEGVLRSLRAVNETPLGTGDGSGRVAGVASNLWVAGSRVRRSVIEGYGEALPA